VTTLRDVATLTIPAGSVLVGDQVTAGLGVGTTTVVGRRWITHAGEGFVQLDTTTQGRRYVDADTVLSVSRPAGPGGDEPAIDPALDAAVTALLDNDESTTAARLRVRARALDVSLRPSRLAEMTAPGVTVGAGAIPDAITLGTPYFRLSESSLASIAEPLSAAGGRIAASPSPGEVKNVGKYDFWVQSPVFAIGLITLSDTNFLEVWVDGQLVRAASHWQANGDGRWWPITVADDRPVHVEVRVLGIAFVGVQISGTAGTAWTATAPARPTRAVFLGDSFTSGVGDPNMRSYAYDVADLLGWECVNAGVSSTGYTTDGGVSGATNFAGRVPTIAAERPDAVVILGSVNDFANRAALQAPAAACFAALAAALPSVPVYVFGVQRMGGGENAYLDEMDAAIGAAAAAAPTVVGFWRTAGWISGTGKVGTFVGDGNADTYVTADGHPTERGHRNYGARIAAAIAGAYPTAKL